MQIHISKWIYSSYIFTCVIFLKGYIYPQLKCMFHCLPQFLAIINSAEYKLLLRYAHIVKAAKAKHKKVWDILQILTNSSSEDKNIFLLIAK